MPGGKRLWRTADGRLVEDGDPDAVMLAYGADDELPKDEKAKPPAKRARRTANKQVRKTADK